MFDILTFNTLLAKVVVLSVLCITTQLPQCCGGGFVTQLKNSLMVMIAKKES